MKLDTQKILDKGKENLKNLWEYWEGRRSIVGDAIIHINNAEEALNNITQSIEDFEYAMEQLNGISIELELK
jgi:hypothetical protein